MAQVAAEVGSTANQYQILAKLAVGGMAEIFLARGDSVAGVARYCVLKRILRERAEDAQFVQMFVDEARLAAQLQHPNIASVYDIGMLGDSYFFTMEYVHGETVRSLLDRAQERNRPLPLACVLTIIAGAAAGLHHAHERHANDGQPLGIVHRDVSPSNLMVSFEGNVKLVDFGVAKADDHSVETQIGMVKGKISYLSPEQCRGARVDRRSDLFSLGIVMWEMLTGKRLYRRANDFETMTAIVNEPPPPPSRHRSEVPRAIDDIVLRLLAKSVTERFQTAAEVVEALENASMLARTIHSTSAVSRLVHELFGARPEPWLEIAQKSGRYATVSLASRPLPQNLDQAQIEEVDLGLSSVIDLSPANAPQASNAPSAPPGVRAAPPVRPARMTHPTPTPSGTAPPFAAPPVPSAPHANAAPSASMSTMRLEIETSIPNGTTLLDADPPVPLSTTLLDPAPPMPAHPTPPHPTPRASALHAPPNGTLLGVSAPPSSATASPFSAFPAMTVLRAQSPAPERVAAASTRNPVITERPGSSSGPMAVLGSAPRPMPRPPGFGPWSPDGTQPRALQPPSPRVNWPLVTVIVLAAAVGVAVAWFVMRTDKAPASPPVSVAPASIPAAPAAPAADAAATSASDPSKTSPRAAPGSGSIAGVPDAHDAHDARNAAKNDDEEIVLGDPADVRGPVAHAPPVDTRPASRDASPPAPVDASLPPPDNALPPRRPPSAAAPPPATSTTATAPPPATSTAAPPGPAPKAPAPPVTQDSLVAMFRNDAYPAIVRICSQAPLKADIARVCLLSACRANNTAQAKRWLLANDRDKYAQLVTYCKDHGSVDLGSMLPCTKGTPGCP